MRNLLLFAFVCMISMPAWGAVGVTSAGKAALSKQEARKLERVERKQARAEARAEQMAAKMEKKMEKRGIAQADNIIDNAKFRLGLYTLAGAIVLSILGALIGFGFLGWLAGVVGLAALGLMIWGLIEYSA